MSRDVLSPILDGVRGMRAPPRYAIITCGTFTMTLNQLRYLVAIADSGLNITLAAEHVHATQPGLSRQIKQLEDELGFLLFTRKGRSLTSLTQSGDRKSVV